MAMQLNMNKNGKCICIEIWKSNVFDLAELYLIPTCITGPNPACSYAFVSSISQGMHAPGPTVSIMNSVLAQSIIHPRPSFYSGETVIGS